MKSKNLICILLCIIVALLPVAAQAEGGSSGQAAAWVGDWAVIPKDGGFSSPRSIAIDGNDNIYVLDANLRLVYKLGAGSSNWTNFALDPGFTGTSDTPWAITAHNLDMYNHVYLLNSIQDTARVVWRYDSAQNKWTDITYGQSFRQPEDIATSSDGTVYVTDSYYNGQYIEGHVLKLAAGSTNWTLIGNWNNGQFEYVPGIAVDSFGTVYVTDYSVGVGSSGRISKLTKAQSTWQLDEHLGSRLKKPLGIIRDNLANLYVADAETKQIHAIKQAASGDVTDTIEREIKLVEAGIAGEKQVRFELENSHIPMFVLHDLYLEFEGLTAQIDYLIITRKHKFVVECKNLYGNIEINSSGDFIRTFSYGRNSIKEGIYSPITQNRRHLELIKRYDLQKGAHCYKSSLKNISIPTTALLLF